MSQWICNWARRKHFFELLLSEPHVMKMCDEKSSKTAVWLSSNPLSGSIISLKWIFSFWDNFGHHAPFLSSHVQSENILSLTVIFIELQTSILWSTWATNTQFILKAWHSFTKLRITTPNVHDSEQSIGWSSQQTSALQYFLVTLK